MNINDRVKELRNALGLTQTEFGNKVGLKQNTVGQIENAQRGVTDRTILLLCQTFNANEIWLRTGEGKMFNSSEDDALASIAAKYGSDELDKRIIEVFLTLPPEQRKVFSSFAKELAGDLNEDDKKADK